MTVKKIAIISLSRGLLGEPFIKHAEELGFRRLRAYGIEVVTTVNACKGIEFLQSHPEARAQDLLDAFSDPSIDMILCAIGGEDTYKLLPYLFEHDELRKAVQHSKKIFLGFSDTTMNHFMLHNVGVNTFYGQPVRIGIRILFVKPESECTEPFRLWIDRKNITF